MAAQRRCRVLLRQLSSSHAAPRGGAGQGEGADEEGELRRIAEQFGTAPDAAWRRFLALEKWPLRHRVEANLIVMGSNEGCDGASTAPLNAAHANAGPRAPYDAFLRRYRHHLRAYIRPDFYTLSAARYREAYEKHGEINVPFLREDCLSELAAFGTAVERLGKHRYGEPRPTYPPGEVLEMAERDPRKHLQTGVNMTAVPSRHLPADAPIQWVYHSPHLRSFLTVVVGCDALFPYFSDLGLAINVMRARPHSRTALGFHFDSIDSSNRGGGRGGASVQPKGVTGVIGIADAEEGGERITFPDVSRARVPQVSQILDAYDPLSPGKRIAGAAPTVFREPTRGVLYLFDGGNVLHGVSAVRKGSRVAAVFLFQEEPPRETAASKAGATFFYG